MPTATDRAAALFPVFSPSGLLAEAEAEVSTFCVSDEETLTSAADSRTAVGAMSAATVCWAYWTTTDPARLTWGDWPLDPGTWLATVLAGVCEAALLDELGAGDVK